MEHLISNLDSHMLPFTCKTPISTFLLPYDPSILSSLLLFCLLVFLLFNLLLSGYLSQVAGDLDIVPGVVVELAVYGLHQGLEGPGAEVDDK